ncbi:MAG TPA: hypothetical protein ENN88_04405, partial [Candidatus Coatesbacteria bacterium]|nr:hypothetical protein [Candidatus Coatesbacteria bacterium]
MRKLLIASLILFLCLPAAAIDKTGLFSVGPRLALWIPMGPINQSLAPSGSLGGLASFGIAEGTSIVV